MSSSVISVSLLFPAAYDNARCLNTINWYSQDADDSKTVDQFFFAINLALTLVRNSLI
jgi:hypothetical protein